MTVKEYTELKGLIDQQDILRVPKEIYQYAKHSVICGALFVMCSTTATYWGA